MIEIIIFLFLNLSIFLMSNLFLKKKFLLNQSGELHQKFVEKLNIPLIIGFYFLITFTYIFFSLEKLIFLIIIFILGLFSDLRILNSPQKKFFLQSLIFIFFIFFYDLHILNTRIELLDRVLDINFFNFILVFFCLMVLINGTNFIDGLNGLVIGYYLIVSIFLINSGFYEDLLVNVNKIFIYFLTFTMMWIANMMRIGFLGDSGSYLLGAFFGVILIKFHQNFSLISPYYIILLLWYPCFENLFSIMRKFSHNRSPIFPDSNHFHQLVFYYVKENYKIKDTYSNNISSVFILIFVSIFICLGSIDPYSTILQISLIIIFSVMYFIIYKILLKFKLYFKK